MSTVQIGEVAALFELAPSALRWWEQCGVLGEIGQRGGRRHYDEDDLRRIGVIYLCHVVGRMPLDRAGAVASGDTTQDWRSVVADQVAVLEQQIAELHDARAYLSHLLTCAQADPTRCPYLEESLATQTPCGRFGTDDIVTAAHASVR